MTQLQVALALPAVYREQCLGQAKGAYGIAWLRLLVLPTPAYLWSEGAPSERTDSWKVGKSFAGDGGLGPYFETSGRCKSCAQDSSCRGCCSPRLSGLSYLASYCPASNFLRGYLFAPAFRLTSQRSPRAWNCRLSYPTEVSWSSLDSHPLSVPKMTVPSRSELVMTATSMRSWSRCYKFDSNSPDAN